MYGDLLLDRLWCKTSHLSQGETWLCYQVPFQRKCAKCPAMSARDTSGSAPQHSHLHNNTMSRNENFWVDQVTVPHPPRGERQGGGGRQGGGADKGGGGRQRGGNGTAVARAIGENRSKIAYVSHSARRALLVPYFACIAHLPDRLDYLPSLLHPRHASDLPVSRGRRAMGNTSGAEGGMSLRHRGGVGGRLRDGAHLRPLSVSSVNPKEISECLAWAVRMQRLVAGSAMRQPGAAGLQWANASMALPVLTISCMRYVCRRCSTSGAAKTVRVRVALSTAKRNGSSAANDKRFGTGDDAEERFGGSEKETRSEKRGLSGHGVCVCVCVCLCVCVCVFRGRTILKRETRMGPGPPWSPEAPPKSVQCTASDRVPSCLAPAGVASGGLAWATTSGGLGLCVCVCVFRAVPHPNPRQRGRVQKPSCHQHDPDFMPDTLGSIVINMIISMFCALLGSRGGGGGRNEN